METGTFPGDFGHNFIAALGAGMGSSRSESTPASQDHVRQVLAERGGLRIPHNFAQTAEPHDARAIKQRGRMPQTAPRNPQTVEFLEMLRLPYNLDHTAATRGPGMFTVSMILRRMALRQGWRTVQAAAKPHQLTIGILPQVRKRMLPIPRRLIWATWVARQLQTLRRLIWVMKMGRTTTQRRLIWMTWSVRMRGTPLRRPDVAVLCCRSFLQHSVLEHAPLH